MGPHPRVAIVLALRAPARSTTPCRPSVGSSRPLASLSRPWSLASAVTSPRAAGGGGVGGVRWGGRRRPPHPLPSSSPHSRHPPRCPASPGHPAWGHCVGTRPQLQPQRVALSAGRSPRRRAPRPRPRSRARPRARCRACSAVASGAPYTHTRTHTHTHTHTHTQTHTHTHIIVRTLPSASASGLRRSTSAASRWLPKRLRASLP